MQTNLYRENFYTAPPRGPLGVARTPTYVGYATGQYHLIEQRKPPLPVSSKQILPLLHNEETLSQPVNAYLNQRPEQTLSFSAIVQS